jgi:hypothetical protein
MMVFDSTNVFLGNKDTLDSGLDATLGVAKFCPLAHAISDPTKNSACDLFAQNGAPCETCTSSGQPYCMTLQAIQVTPA